MSHNSDPVGSRLGREDFRFLARTVDVAVLDRRTGGFRRDRGRQFHRAGVDSRLVPWLRSWQPCFRPDYWRFGLPT